MGSNHAKQLITTHKYIDLIEQICVEASDDKFRVPVILGENKDTRLAIMALFREAFSPSNMPTCEDKINIYWLKNLLQTHIAEYNTQFPDSFIDPVEYIKYKSEILRLSFYSLKTAILNKEHKVKYNVHEYIENYTKPINITIEV